MNTPIRPAFFIDRDGTIIVDRHYPRQADAVELIDGAAEAVARVNALGVPVVLVTNQSGIGRGLITIGQYEAVHAKMVTLLAQKNAHLDGVYYCPHAPDHRDAAECRKPGLGMYREAAAALSLDLAQSVYVGDRWRDVEPGLRAGGLGILVPSMETPEGDVLRARAEATVCTSLDEAVSSASAWWESSRQ